MQVVEYIGEKEVAGALSRHSRVCCFTLSLFFVILKSDPGIRKDKYSKRMEKCA